MSDQLDDGSWVVTEFAEAEFVDERLRQRLVELATVLGGRPGASLPEACGSRAMLKAAYRFFDNETVDPEAILESHIEATVARLRSVPLALAVQDTTELDFSAHPATTGMGPLAHPDHQGLHVHSTLAITPERVPLGLLAQEVWVRDPEQVGQRTLRKARPIEEKESQKWLNSLAAVNEISALCPQTRLVSVGDREADVYDLFLAERGGRVDLLVRAAWNRRVEHEERYLWAAVAAQPVAGTIAVHVPRRPKQPVAGTIAVHVPRRPKQPAREATLEIRFGPVTLRPPKHRASEHLPTVTVWAVEALETAPPAGVEAIEWLLLTTCPVGDLAAAIERVSWYCGRWGIEIFHKVLKSGCRIEQRQLETADRLRRCLALYSVIAWRVLYATMLSRVLPELACTALLEAEEWQALFCTIHQTATPPSEPPSLEQAVRWIAQLGGFLGRKRDGPPGVTTLWRGFQRLWDLTIMYRILRRGP